MVESAAQALGCPVIPAGTGQTEMQLRTIADLRPAAYVGTPSFLKILLDRAAAEGSRYRVDPQGAGRRRGVSGGTARPSSASRGIAALQCYGTADLGLIAYESLGPDGAVCDGMVLDEGIIVEIVQPGTGEPVPPGEVGEVVVTTLTPEYPLIRFATGDLSALSAGRQPVRPDQPPHPRLARARRPDGQRCAACSCIRCRSPRSCAGTNRSSGRGSSSSGRRAPTR